MAFDSTKLQRIGPQNSNAPSFWTYASGADALATVDTTGFFNGAAGKLQVNDVIMVIPDSGAGGFMKVASNTRDLTASPPVEGVVDTLDALSLGTTDTD